jgi:hypothetical protein
VVDEREEAVLVVPRQHVVDDDPSVSMMDALNSVRCAVKFLR